METEVIKIEPWVDGESAGNATVSEAVTEGELDHGDNSEHIGRQNFVRQRSAHSQSRSRKRKEKIYRCTLCPYTTNRRWNLFVSHMNTHSKTKFYCEYCAFVAKQSIVLKKHIQNKHPEFYVLSDDEISANNASMEDNQAQNLVVNENSNSSSMAIATCSPARSPTYSVITSQSETNVGTTSSSAYYDRRANFMCNHCEIMFWDRALYFMHMGLHTSEDPWKCSVCSKVFHDVYGFTSHLINH